MEKSKKIIVVLVVLAIIGAGYAYGPKILSKYQKKTDNAALEKILKINTKLTMNETQKGTFDDSKKLLEGDIESYDGLAELARLKQDLLDYDGAIEIYEKLRKVKPDDITTLNNLAVIYFNQKKFEESEALYLRILEITPKWMSSYRELSTIYTYHLKDKAPGFEAVLLKGQEQFPEAKNDFIGLLAFYYDEVVPNKAKAIEYYEQLVKIYPANAGLKERLEELKKS
jgi:tetratricopeptide (TPR) repeat protein